MKRILALSLVFSSLILSNVCFIKAIAEDFSDVDYNFIDNAFKGIKPVTNEQFEKTINALTPQPVENTFLGRLKTFLFGRKYGVEPAPKGQNKEIDTGGDLKAIQDIQNGVYYIKLLVSIVGANGDVIPLGNYKIQEKKDKNILLFSQGGKETGYLILRDFQDDENNQENKVAYSRVDIVDENIVRIVYSTLDSVKCAYAKVFR